MYTITVVTSAPDTTSPVGTKPGMDEDGWPVEPHYEWEQAETLDEALEAWNAREQAHKGDTYVMLLVEGEGETMDDAPLGYIAHTVTKDTLWSDGEKVTVYADPKAKREVVVL